MKIACFQPPAPLRVGGLDAAIAGINAALRACGHEVLDTPDGDSRCDAAHFHGLWQPAHARLSRHLHQRAVPFVISPHGMLEPWAWRHKWWKKWPYFHLVEKQHFSRASSLLATSRDEAERLRRFAPRQRIETLPLGLTGGAEPDASSARRLLGWAPDEIVLLYLSRLHVKKGPDLLLRALTDFPLPSLTRLVMVGDGERSFVESLRAFASREAARLPRIDWVGAVWGDARWKYFQGADLFCLPTHSENFGLAVLEALQVGTPALTTVGTPWAADLSPPRGFIIRPRVAEIREAITRFLREPQATAESRSALAAWTRERFAWAQLAPRYAELFASLSR